MGVPKCSTTDMPFANLLDAMLECLGVSHH